MSAQIRAGPRVPQNEKAGSLMLGVKQLCVVHCDSKVRGNASTKRREGTSTMGWEDASTKRAGGSKVRGNASTKRREGTSTMGREDASTKGGRVHQRRAGGCINEAAGGCINKAAGGCINKAAGGCINEDAGGCINEEAGGCISRMHQLNRRDASGGMHQLKGGDASHHIGYY
ncbi:hypothetical protein CY34DRAFT_109567 [Suillus luteus UH-Slu-Lm8-n1]|uniref:Uncharacterized protein n=1 Tax=Suillus luteus UH-Slu-Lm8-n1 TaxID=930992 RepID=A0A0D0ADU3_9AGAM|nr:hypothetical protein CY34DRAFT_109567 [Suillus luteus UH-Slu-Lm8-n1]